MRLSIDEHARRYRLLRAARIRSVTDALAQSAAIRLTDRDGRQWLAIVSPDLEDQRQLRATRLGTDGPIGHCTRRTPAEIVEAIVDYDPASAEPVDEQTVIDWCNTAEYIEGSARVAEVQRHNQGGSK